MSTLTYKNGNGKIVAITPGDRKITVGPFVNITPALSRLNDALKEAHGAGTQKTKIIDALQTVCAATRAIEATGTEEEKIVARAIIANSYSATANTQSRLLRLLGMGVNLVIKSFSLMLESPEERETSRIRGVKTAEARAELANGLGQLLTELGVTKVREFSTAATRAALTTMGTVIGYVTLGMAGAAIANAAGIQWPKNLPQLIGGLTTPVIVSGIVLLTAMATAGITFLKLGLRGDAKKTAVRTNVNESVLA